MKPIFWLSFVLIVVLIIVTSESVFAVTTYDGTWDFDLGPNVVGRDPVRRMIITDGMTGSALSGGSVSPSGEFYMELQACPGEDALSGAELHGKLYSDGTGSGYWICGSEEGGNWKAMRIGGDDGYDDISDTANLVGVILAILLLIGIPAIIGLGIRNIIKKRRLKKQSRSKEKPSKPMKGDDSIKPLIQGSALVKFTASNFIGSEVIADVEFVDLLNRINEYAAANNVKILVTNSFRGAGKTLTGTIVEPAKYSNHLVGHAIDMNVVYGDNQLCNSKCLADKNLPEDVKRFIEAIRKDPELRWGGDFADKDVVHIDDGLNSDMARWRERYDATQRSFFSGELGN